MCIRDSSKTVRDRIQREEQSQQRHDQGAEEFIELITQQPPINVQSVQRFSPLPRSYVDDRRRGSPFPRRRHDSRSPPRRHRRRYDSRSPSRRRDRDRRSRYSMAEEVAIGVQAAMESYQNRNRNNQASIIRRG